MQVKPKNYFLVLFVVLLLGTSFVAVAQNEHKPVIYVSGHTYWEGENLKSSNSVYNMKALLEKHGAEVYLVREEWLEEFPPADGVVLMGNDYDIDPARYGAKPNPKTKSELKQFDRNDKDFKLAQQRSVAEYETIDLAKRTNTPILGVCGGMQRINVAYGGTLHQHVEGQLQVKGDNPQPPYIPVENIDITPNTKLAVIAKGQSSLLTPNQNESGKALVNSLHHQAVDKLGEGLKKSAISSHGTIEAIESESDQFVMGVQWHPEHLPDSPLTEKLVKAFVKAAILRKQEAAKQKSE